MSWRKEKYIPRKIVVSKLEDLSLKLLVKIEWCVHVTVRPEDTKIIVLRRGISNGLKGMIPKGGQICPISIEGDKDEWKNAQKKEKKNKISDEINKIIPRRIPL